MFNTVLMTALHILKINKKKNKQEGMEWEKEEKILAFVRNKIKLYSQRLDFVKYIYSSKREMRYQSSI